MLLRTLLTLPLCQGSCEDLHSIGSPFLKSRGPPLGRKAVQSEHRCFASSQLHTGIKHEKDIYIYIDRQIFFFLFQRWPISFHRCIQIENKTLQPAMRQELNEISDLPSTQASSPHHHHAGRRSWAGVTLPIAAWEEEGERETHSVLPRSEFSFALRLHRNPRGSAPGSGRGGGCVTGEVGSPRGAQGTKVHHTFWILGGYE